MRDRRENIHARILEIVDKVEGIERARRNVTVIPDDIRPAAIITDGDETVLIKSEQDIRSRTGPIVNCTPGIRLLMGDDSENVGTLANTLRARVLYAILSDADLLAECGPNGRLEYGGLILGIGGGRQTEIEITILLNCTYPLKLTELAD